MPTCKPRGGERLALLLLCLACAALTVSVRADAPAWKIKPPERSSLTPTDSLNVGLPPDLSAAQIAGLGVEVDHIDVTALAQIGGGTIAYRPPQPLDVGAHELRVVEYGADGRLIPRGEWAFTVAANDKTPREHGWSVKGNAGANLSERVAESDLSEPAPSRFTANGTFDVKAVRTLAEWSAEATVNGLFGTENGASAIGGQAVQPGQMQLALRHRQDNLILGDQTLPFDNLAISGLARRGVSGHVAALPFDSEATAFSVRDSPLAGFYGGLGVGDSNDVVSGVMLQSHPIRGAAQALTLQAGFVTGSSPGGLSLAAPYPGGNGSFPPNAGNVVQVQSGSGDAWVLGLSSAVPGTALKMHAEFASSSFDFPGLMGQPNSRADDNAYGCGLGYVQPLGGRWTLSGNASYQNIGTYFVSLANPTLSPDRRTGNLTGTLNGHGLNLSAGGGFTQDNTDDSQTIATVRSLPRNANLSYSPALPASVTSWLGAPALNLAWQDARSHNETLPSGSQATASDVVNDTAMLNFSYARFSWQAGVSGGKFRDYTGLQDDTDTFGPTAAINVSLAGKGFLSLSLQQLDAHDLKTDTHTLDHNYSFTGGDSFWNDRLSAQLTLAVNHNTQQIIPGTIPPQLVGNDVVLKTATGQLTWHAVRATRTRGGLDVGLSSSWNESTGLNSAALTSQGFAALATHGFQGFLTLSSRWPLDLGDH